MRHILFAISAATLLAAPALSASTKLPAGSNASASAPSLKAIASNLPARIAGVSPFSAGNLVANGSFESADFSGWEQVNDTSFTFVTDELAAGGPTDGNWHAAFGPTDPGGGGILQTIATTPGALYDLSFDIANLGGTPNAFGLFWNEAFVFIEFDVPQFDYQTILGSLQATGSSTTLGFIFYNEPSFWLLDNVSLTSGVIPEPATWAMLIIGFGMIGATFRTRRKQAGLTAQS